MGEQRVQAGFDSLGGLLVGRNHAGIGEVGDIMGAGIDKGVEIAEGAGASRLDGCDPVTGPAQSVGQAGDRCRLAGIHGGADNADDMQAVGPDGFFQGIMVKVQDVTRRVHQQADRHDSGRGRHAVVAFPHPPDHAAGGQHVGSPRVEFGNALELVRGISRARGQHHKVAGIELRGAPLGKLDPLVRAKALDAAEDKVARLRGFKASRHADGVLAVDPAGSKRPFGKRKDFGRDGGDGSHVSLLLGPVRRAFASSWFNVMVFAEEGLSVR